MYAVYGAANRESACVEFIAAPDEYEILQQDERIFVPSYTGVKGWLALDLEVRSVDWSEVRDFLEDSFRQVALKRMLAALEGDRT